MEAQSQLNGEGDKVRYKVRGTGVEKQGRGGNVEEIG